MKRRIQPLESITCEAVSRQRLHARHQRQVLLPLLRAAEGVDHVGHLGGRPMSGFRAQGLHKVVNNQTM